MIKRKRTKGYLRLFLSASALAFVLAAVLGILGCNIIAVITLSIVAVLNFKSGMQCLKYIDTTYKLFDTVIAQKWAPENVIPKYLIEDYDTYKQRKVAA